MFMKANEWQGFLCCHSVAQSCPPLCNPMDWSMPGLPIPHHLPKFFQVNFPCISVAIQPSHPLDTLFSFCPESFPASALTFPVSWLFESGDQNTGASASASALPKNIQDWFPLGFTGLISLLLKGLSGVFSNTTVWRHQFFGALPPLWSSSHYCTWQLGRL